jgi:hypothetical protein
MSIIKTEKCDGPDCTNQKDMSELRAGDTNHYMTLNMLHPQFMSHEKEFHFCSLDCISNFINLFTTKESKEDERIKL